MKKQKFNSITFHAAAEEITDQYFGKIPDFRITTSARITSLNSSMAQSFWIIFQHVGFNICSLEFNAIEETPAIALRKFENSIMKFWDIETPKENAKLIPFDLPY